MFLSEAFDLITLVHKLPTIVLWRQRGVMVTRKVCSCLFSERGGREGEEEVKYIHNIVPHSLYRAPLENLLLPHFVLHASLSL